MFISNGGNNRLAGLLLAAATFGVWVAGPGMIGYVPIMVVGALIFYLGIALLEEALVDTWGKMNRLEYLTVLAIVLIMGVYDFVAGILAGIVLACLNMVVQTSRRSAIRATYSGETVESTVRRHPVQRHFLHEVGYQIFVTKLAGFLFFGSIVKVEKQSRALIEEEAFRREPIRFLVFDLTHVNGIDYSAAEAFTRMERILGRRDVKMIISGVHPDSETGKSLQNVGLWAEDSSVMFFQALNQALEYCENELLKAFYRKRDALYAAEQPRRQSLDVPHSQPRPQPQQKSSSTFDPFGGSAASPRQAFLDRAATSALTSSNATNQANNLNLPSVASHSRPHTNRMSLKQPLPLLLSTFQPLVPEKDIDFWYRAVPYFTRQTCSPGSILYNAHEAPDAFYILEAGMLHAAYDLPVGQYDESIVAGTTCGELPFFSDTKRTATVSVEGETEAVVWRLGREEWARLQADWGEGAAVLLTCALKLTKERMDAVVGYVLTTAG